MDKTMHTALKRHREGKMDIDRLLSDEDAHGVGEERHNEDRNLENQEASDLAPTTKRIDGAHDYDKAVPGEHDNVPDLAKLEGDKSVPPIDIKELLGSEGGSGLRKHAMLEHDMRGREHDARDSKGSEESGEEHGDKKKSRFRQMKGLFQANKYE